MADSAFQEQLKEQALEAGAQLSPSHLSALERYYDLLFRWNKTINLTALAPGAGAVDRLLLEPIIAARWLPAGEGRMLDIGSGSGSPAIPMKVMAPDLTLTMVESKERKAAFLREAIRHLSLTGASVEPVRYQELLSRPECPNSFDVLSIRAVALSPQDAAELLRLVASGGVILAFHSDTTDLSVSFGQNSDGALETTTVDLLPHNRSRLTIVRPL